MGGCCFLSCEFYAMKYADLANPPYPDLGAGVAKYRRAAMKAGSIMAMAKAERHAYADAIEKAIRAKHRTLHMKPTPALTPRWYKPPSITRLLRYETPIQMAGDPQWETKCKRTDDKWAVRQKAVYAAAMAEKHGHKFQQAAE